MTLAAAAMGDPQALAWAAAWIERQPSRPQKPTDDWDGTTDGVRWAGVFGGPGGAG